MKSKKLFRCPLCGSLLTQTRYYEIIGVWEERQKLEKNLREQLRNLRIERQKLMREKKEIKVQMEKQMKKAVKEALEKGKEKEKSRADRLAKMIERKTREIQDLNKKIKELQEQLKRGTTPQVEGLNLEKELVKQLKREFTEDKIEHHGKNGDILHYVNFRNKQVGMILYECKKTAKFHPAFIDQVKKAVGLRQATYGVLVTTAFKKDTAGFWVEKDILVVHPYGAIYIAKVLRSSIIEIHSLKISRVEMEKRSKELMEYIRGEDFKTTVKDTIYRTRNLYKMLAKEVESHTGIWRNRIMHYRTIHENVTRLELVTSNIVRGLPAKEALKHLKQNQLLPAPYLKSKKLDLLSIKTVAEPAIKSS
ncbi:MAG: DUF2130 domain-containing protein [bacterium]